MQIASESQQNAPTFFAGFLNMTVVNGEVRNKENEMLMGDNASGRTYLSCRYVLYSRIVGNAINHQKINLYTINGFLGGIQRQNFKKNVFNSTVKNITQRLRT